MTAPSPARPDLLAFERSMRLDVPDLVTELRDMLGAKLVAFLGGVGETRAVRMWADGSRRIQDSADERRLRIAHQAAALIRAKDSPAVAQVWFQGLNPQLDDRSPARLLRDGDLDETGPLVLTAARAFAATG
jgi:hypothetical protein